MFNTYKKKAISEMREITESEITAGATFLQAQGVSISDADLEDGCPKLGDMIARNPKNHDDLWLVNATYFSENFEKA